MTESSDYRVVSCYDDDGDSRYIASVKRSPETDAMTDEQIIERLKEWRRNEGRLRAVDDPE